MWVLWGSGWVREGAAGVEVPFLAAVAAFASPLLELVSFVLALVIFVIFSVKIVRTSLSDSMKLTASTLPLLRLTFLSVPVRVSRPRRVVQVTVIVSPIFPSQVYRPDLPNLIVTASCRTVALSIGLGSAVTCSVEMKVEVSVATNRVESEILGFMFISQR